MTSSKYTHWITANWRDHLAGQAQQLPADQADAINHRLNTAVVVSIDELIEGRVQFGSIVTVFGIEEEEEQSFQIVSRDESESAPGLIDESAPLAQALFGHREGDVVNVRLANGSNSHYEITHIRLPKS